MRKHQRTCVQACQSVGLNVLGIEHRGKHWVVICDKGKVICPSTPSDRRFLHNLKSNAKRLLINPL